MEELESTKGYNPHLIEERYYAIWEKRNYFEPSISNQNNHQVFSIMLPPPNVTGSLHIGHALNHTLIDIMVRYKRMDGFKTLWQPGVDHAGIATQNIVQKQLLNENLTKEQLGREAFLERVWEWKEKSGDKILSQMRRLGASCAWNRVRFTMDKGLAASVREVFCRLYEEKLIVRGEYMVNWCTHDGALSDIEVEYEENEGKLYHIRYPIVDSNDVLIVATTRPETYFGDTAVMVNPQDERYKHLIGKKVRLPIINREIPIIADDYVDMEFGSGAVKVTPAHDPNDYEVGLRHQLPLIKVFDTKGILNAQAAEFEGLERLDARGKIVEKLKQMGMIEKIENHQNQVGKCYRCGNLIEPYISQQWFIKKELAVGAIEKINTQEAKFYPAIWKNNYDAWMRELRDWCISRQLWWGHRIPVFYCECGNEFASREEKPTQCPRCKKDTFTQDPDVLDTWFSSALWAFSPLGYANGDFGEGKLWNRSDIAEFYPNSLLITGFDILFFWVARMLMMGEHTLGKLPFKDIYLHALVRDEHGKKMSKSKGNVVDPLEIIQSHSADALRFTLAILCAMGRDVRLSSTQLDISKNFTNKIYNATQFLLLYYQKYTPIDSLNFQSMLGRYMKSRLNVAISEVREQLDSYRFNDAATTLYRFLWGEFCDWGIELAKADKSAIQELGAVFMESLKLLHPFMPFITEYAYSLLSGIPLEERESIMVMPYPRKAAQETSIEDSFSVIIDSIISIRRLKANVDVAAQKIPLIYIQPQKTIDEALLKQFIPRLSKVESIEIVSQKKENCLADIGKFSIVYLPKAGLDLSSIIARLHKQQEKSQKEKDKLLGMLNNEKFMANAPKELLQKNRVALIELEERLLKINAELESLKGLD
ncbi:valine--tRNA ligase [Helicobacter monodelphidis]|uniref:valine--tRNA ligase n=1 Tax=Helicobacter sp. 15-1451 TaxID=2004995 RepID=UPI000DCBF547|nr:valine--tRNA ligase [Helicobacter sp. 15-1451]RAX59311.1 valine--tRNA ligase [Helicobacter sp. 15-1451]